MNFHLGTLSICLIFKVMGESHLLLIVQFVE